MFFERLSLSFEYSEICTTGSVYGESIGVSGMIGVSGTGSSFTKRLRKLSYESIRMMYIYTATMTRMKLKIALPNLLYVSEFVVSCMNASDVRGSVSTCIAKKLPSVITSRMVCKAILYGLYFTSMMIATAFSTIHSKRMTAGLLKPKTMIAEKSTFFNCDMT